MDIGAHMYLIRRCPISELAPFSIRNFTEKVSVSIFKFQDKVRIENRDGGNAKYHLHLRIETKSG